MAIALNLASSTYATYAWDHNLGVAQLVHLHMGDFVFMHALQ